MHPIFKEGNYNNNKDRIIKDIEGERYKQFLMSKAND